MSKDTTVIKECDGKAGSKGARKAAKRAAIQARKDGARKKRKGARGKKTPQPPRFTAATADKYELYQFAVQSADLDVKFLDSTYRSIRGRGPRHLREDFCGTSLLCCEWVEIGEEYTAEGFDLDPEPLAWGREHNLSLIGDAAERIDLHLADAREEGERLADVRIAQNFSYWIFQKRAELLDYFRRALAGLADDGIFIIDLYGGTEANEEMIDSCHVLSPNYMSFLGQGQDYRDYYLKKRDQGIALEFYSAWLSRILDPYAGRLYGWTCWRFGAEGFYMWSLTDTGGAPSSWNEYLTIKSAYAPIFLDATSVTAGKHLEAAREGVQDYEYFVMLDRALRAAAAEGVSGPEIDEARRLLDTLPMSVLTAGGHETLGDGPLGEHNWLNDKIDRTLADEGRIRILAALTALAAK